MKSLTNYTIKPFEFQKRFGRRFVLHPIHVGLFVIGLGLQALGIVPQELRDLEYWYNLIWVTGRGSIYLLTLLFIQPYIFRLAAVKCIPFSMILFGQYTLFILIYIALSDYYVSQFTHVPGYKRALNNIIIAIPFILFLATYLWKDAARAMYEDPSLYPLWPSFRKRNLPELQYDAPPHDNKASGNRNIVSDVDALPTQTPTQSPLIHYMQSKPPYTEIHDQNGYHIVKSSLSQLINNMPEHETLGLRVHRSYWVAYSEYDKVIYENGNPKLVLKNGGIIPLNRKAAKNLRAYLRETARDTAK